MATFLPSLNTLKSKMTAGETRFATRLHTNLDESFLCWHDVSVGSKDSRYTDFIVLNADLGLLLLEVKDWSLDNIRSIDSHSASVLKNGKPTTWANPLEQARQCTYRLTGKLERDPDLVDHMGRYEVRLRFPYGFGVVFPNISSDEVMMEGWSDLFPAHRVIYRDQMTETVDSEEFRFRIEEIFDVKFKRSLTEKMIDRVRWHIFPEIRIADTQDLFKEDIGIETIPNDAAKINQFDIQQEKLARQIGDGHRVIRGVAGSGKTQIIAYRCQYFAQAASKPVLVLYYNIAAKAMLRNALKARGVLDKVHVMHFHQWCADQLRRSGISFGREDMIQVFAKAVSERRISTAQYSTVMVDEGKDFEKEWIEIIADFCEDERLPLLFVYDDAQSIYEKRTGLGFSLASAGVMARGRTTVLKTNYRSPEFVRDLSSRFLREVLARTKDMKDLEEEWLDSIGIGVLGTPAHLVVCDGVREEAVKIARWLFNLHRLEGVPWSDICVIVRTKFEAERLASLLGQQGIPVYDVSESKSSKENFDLSDASVKITTVHSSKGLEFPNVLVSGICDFASSGDRETEDARLLYVAMTRSKGRLVLTARMQTPLVARIQALIEESNEALGKIEGQP